MTKAPLAVLLLPLCLQVGSPAHARSSTLDQDNAEVMWGRFHVGLATIDDDGDRRKVASHLRRTLPLLDQLYGPPPLRVTVEVVIDRSLTSNFSLVADSCHARDVRGSVRVGEALDLWVYIRAIAEAYRLCGHGVEQSFDGAMAEAANQMVLQRVGVKAPWRMERIHYQLVNRPGIGGGKEYRTDTFPALVGVRFQLVATALRLFEEEHPSFFRRFNGALAEKLSQGTSLREVDQMAVAAAAEPAFSEWSTRQHLFGHRPRGNQLLLVAQGDWVRLVAIRRDEFGTETPWANLPVGFTIDPLGKETRRTTDEHGEATLELSEATHVKPGQRVTLRAHADGLNDSLTFAPVPHDTNRAGPPNVWDVAVWAAGGGSFIWAWWSHRRGRRTTTMSGWTTRFGRAAPALRVSGLVGIAILCASIGAGGLTRAASRLDNARWLSSAEPQLAAALRAMPGGQRVVVMGRIDPVAPPVDEARGFALYLGEYYSTDSTWEWDYTIAPPFTVLLDDGPAEVLNGCRDAHGGWSIATPAYNDDCYRLLHLPVTEYNGDGNDRYRGFKPGDPVLVFGTAQRGGVIASAVSGGDLEEYADSVARDAWTRLAIGVLWVIVAFTLGLRVVFLAIPNRRRSGLRRGARDPR